MDEPRRLLEDSPSALERALLDAGTAYRCSADSRLRTIAAVGLAGSAALTASAGGVAGTSWLAEVGWLKSILGISALGALAAVPLGYVAWQRHAVPVTAVVAPQSSAERSDVALPPALSPNKTPADGTTAGTSNSDAAPSVKFGPSTRAEAKSDSLQSSGLAGELAALDAARALLAKGDAPGALARLDAYNRSYPRGRLKLEGEVLRIDALKRSGQTAIAKQRGEAFLLKYPNSVLASRVRSLLGP